MAKSRSVVDTLDLCTSVSGSPSSSQAIGWLSPRISFSTGIIEKSPEVKIGSSGREVQIGSSGRDGERSGDDRALDFEFCMGSSSLDPVAGGCMLSADELFHKGRLRPQSVPFSVSFSGPLEPPCVDVAPQRQSGSKSGPLTIEDSRFSGVIQRPGMDYPRFSGPLNMPRIASPSRSLNGGVSVEGKPKSQAWEKVIGLLRRARSDSHRDQLCPSREQTVPCRKQSTPKNTGSAASSLRLIFRRNSSTEKTAKAEMASSKPKFSPSEPHPEWSPPLPAATFQAKPTGLAALHVASPVYPSQSSASEPERDPEFDMWSSSATEVDLRPASGRDSWRMLETESSLEITFDRFDNKPHAGKKVERSAGTTTAATNPSRIVLKNLERCSNPASKVGKGQDQLRALRTREIRRSPERLASSYTSSVRVTPVLNVPVCIAPAMRSSKATKGRLASLRSLLSFKKEKDERPFSDPAMAA